MKDKTASSHKPLTLVGIVLLLAAGLLLWQVSSSSDITAPEPVTLTTSVHNTIDTLPVVNAATFDRQPEGADLSQRPAIINELMLVGVVLSSDKASSSAVIEYRGGQRIYAVGDPVVVPELMLRKVSEKHALLDYQTQHITLPLRRGLMAAQPVPSPAAVQQPRHTAHDDKNNHAALIKLTPRFEDEALQGLSASPNGDSRQFLALGLMSDDIITEINGVSMTSKEAVKQAATLLQGREPLQLSVRRQGRLMTVFIDPQYSIEME